ncbi:MAG: acyl-CoA dehydrogenase [Deltaproteobacteria bacterium]|nr:acyl-CoA dehydrogenase [Deltaproteobacteria bacterium]MBT4642325.1 acyl-CoA dehydrogenase [Deltaproteobacteria bacterium]MBT7710170.1 acyl-CoA dehydrogenase [Deltaproteobacteria bacterium]
MEMLGYTDAHHEYRERLRLFLEKEVTPNANQWEKDHIVPKSAWRKMGAAGFLCTWADKAYGGQGLDFLYSVITAEEMMRTQQTGLVAMLHSDIVAPYIDSFGSEEIKKKYLPGCVSGDCITAVAMTEPGAGSDVASIETTAVEDGDEIVINGSKTFISNGINCDMVIIAARDPAVENKHAAVSLYIVDDGTPGFTRGRHLEKMGMHSQDTAELFFSDCRIPKTNILGKKGDGFMILMQKLQQERLMSAIGSVAGMELTLEGCVAYAKETEINGKPLSKLQSIKFTLAEMATDTRMNRALLDAAIVGHMAGENVIAETMMAKYASSEAGNLMADRALDLFGEYGMLEDNELVRSFRDVRITTIFAGTTEIMKTIIAQSMGL